MSLSRETRILSRGKVRPASVLSSERFWSAGRRMLFPAMALTSMAGCGTDVPAPSAIDAPVEPPLEALSQSAASDFAPLSMHLKWSDDDAVASSPKKLIADFGTGEAGEDHSRRVDDAVSSSDVGSVELIPTPLPQKEVVAEIVPAPLGVPTSVDKTPASRLETETAPPQVEDVADASAASSSKIAPPRRIDLSKPSLPIRMASDRTTSLGGESDPSANDGPVHLLGDGAVSASSEANPLVANAAIGDAMIPDAMTGPIDYRTWNPPQVTLFITGQQHGYIEPCGCTGLENQKGGVARRMTFMKQLREMGWTLAPIDAGNLVRRYGEQAAVKFHRSLEALRMMGYVAVGFGPDDLRVSSSELIFEAADDGDPQRSIYASANVVVLDPSLMPNHRIVEENGMTIGVTSILDPESIEGRLDGDLIVGPPLDAAKRAIKDIQSSEVDFTILTFYGDEDSAMDLVRAVPGFDLVVVAGGYGEPTYQPQSIAGSTTKMILTGNKGMYAGLVGLDQDQDMRYARVPLTHEFEDAAEMRQLMAEYQDQLESLGFDALGLDPIPHSSGHAFVGSEACGQCHTNAYEIWETSMHFEATEHLVHPGERGDVSRHFDPECLSCHVTGWDPQGYYPYASGYLDLAASRHLHGNGCENCHGPGSAHAEAEAEGSAVSDDEKLSLREQMQLPLDQARETCMKCHDLDNSPDFHEEGAFDDYWAQVEHYGVD
ncbi:MAG: multiheme c-type cytochrome [Planctomycetota bacterium]